MENIEQQVKKTILRYKLLDKKDKIAVALSGGKDSTTVLYVLNKLGYNVQGLMIDLHLGEWSKIHRKNMEGFCKQLNVKLTVVDLKKELGMGICFIKSVLKEQKNLTGCTVCGVIKKWILNKWAKKLKVNKIATGHNLDDECQTVLMNFLKGNIYLGANSSPATGIPTKGFVQRVKPLFFIPENEIRSYSKKMKFPILYDKCPCAIGTYRVETRKWMENFSDKEKLNIVENFQKLVPKLRKKHKTIIQKCKICGEPSSSDVCNACKIFSVLKDVKKT
jgi:tRNA-5-methyluridine54 2-sulfurtransferase